MPDAAARAPRRAGPGALLLAALLAVALAGCGHRTAPQPVLRAAPPVINVWQRDQHAMVAWTMPPSEAVLDFDGLIGHQLVWRRFPLLCIGCDPVEEQELRLGPGHPAVRLEAGWAFYRMPLPQQPADWHFRVATRYGSGATPFSRVAVLSGRVEIPRHSLAWKLLPPLENGTEGALPFRRVQLYWPPRRERIVRMVSEQGSLVEQEEFFRANLYRRAAGRKWPLLPMDSKPLEGVQRIVSLAVGTRAAPAARIEFTLRLVDQFGNEGPATPPVTPAVTAPVTPAVKPALP